jgi:hypothetical protein
MPWVRNISTNAGFFTANGNERAQLKRSWQSENNRTEGKTIGKKR